MIGKKNMFMLIWLILTIFLFNQNPIFAKQQVIIYGDDNYPPYSYKENGVAKGIYVDILKKAFSQIKNYNVTIKMVPWKRGLNYIKTGKGIAIFPPYFIDKRTTWMLYSEPILQEQVVVFGTAEKLKGKVKWPEDFYGFTFGINRGFALSGLGGKKLEKAVKDGKIKIQEANSNKLNFKKLENNRIDFYLNDKKINISQFPSIKRGIFTVSNWGHLGFTKKDKNFVFLSDFQKKFNQEIKKMKESNAIKKIVETYMK